MDDDNATESAAFDDAEPLSPESEQCCPVCGTALAGLYSNGRMGCPFCYEAFREVVGRALLVLHGASRHIGKTL
jgi:protein arginine kinase activator